MARTYPVKKGIKITSEHILEQTRKFTDDAKIKDEHVIATIPGMKVIDFSTDGKKLFASTEADESSPDPLKTIKVYNDMVESITGFNSKERKKRLSKV